MSEESAFWITFHLPTDATVLAALGRVSILHSQLDFVLRRTVKSLTGITPEEADKALAFEGSGMLRDMVKRAAIRKLGRESAAVLKLRAMLRDCERLTLKRNAMIHGLWAQKMDGDAMVGAIVIGHDGHAPVPTAQELDDLAREIGSLVTWLNDARLTGFLAQALAKASAPIAQDETE